MNDKYDVVIIGAGIGGLVCGCYLVKAGLKVLIVEQHDKPGGYCSSFTRKGYRFDVGVHYLGGAQHGVLGKIIDELGIREKLNLKQYDPTDKFVMPDQQVFIRANPLDTVEEFKKSFSSESANIDRFFGFIRQKDFLNIYKKVKKLTFQQVLDEFFTGYRLKGTLGALLCNIGTAPDKASAFASIVLFRQYILDPGYYPAGGMQVFPDAIVEKFKENGGDIQLNIKVERILTDGNMAVGVLLKNGKTIKAGNVVSNADASSTFGKLIGRLSKEQASLDKMQVTPSMCIAYLGLDGNFFKENDIACNAHYFSSYDMNKIYFLQDSPGGEFALNWVSCSFPSAHCSNDKTGTANLLTFAAYNNRDFWRKNKTIALNSILSKAEEYFPDLKKSVKMAIPATPSTFYKYTLNRQGAFCGWLTTNAQLKINVFPQVTSIDGLNITGHWANSGYLPFGGIPVVAFSGRRCARIVSGKVNKSWGYREIYV